MSNYLVWLLFSGVVGALLAFALRRAYVGRRRSRSQLGIRSFIPTLVLLFAGCAYGARLEQVGDINCQAADGDYTYGEFGWSTVPPGPTCTFTDAEHGFDEVRGPSPVMSGWLALVAVGGARAAAVARCDRPTSGNGRDVGRAAPEGGSKVPDDGGSPPDAAGGL